MNDNNLSNEEMIFLKFINEKSTNIEFSSRWSFQYNINPIKEIEKLVKLKYVICNNNYILTQKAMEVLNKNKKLFMTDKQKAGKKFKELTNEEYEQLKVFKKLKEYNRLKNNELSLEKGYTKNDVLWNIYNQQKDIYIRRKDYIMASVVYNCIYKLLKKEKKHIRALDFMICCLYLRVYDNYLYEKHLMKFIKELKLLLKRNNMDITKFDDRHKFISENIELSIQTNLPYLYDADKVNILKRKINEFLNT